VVDQRVGEGHAHGARTDDEVVRVQRLHAQETRVYGLGGTSNGARAKSLIGTTISSIGSSSLSVPNRVAPAERNAPIRRWTGLGFTRAALPDRQGRNAEEKRERA